MTIRIEVETVIIGYHVYKEIWTAMLGEVLTCRRETDNFHNQFAVMVMKESDIARSVKVTTMLKIFLQFSTHLTLSTRLHMQSYVQVFNQLWSSYYSKSLFS